MLVCNVSLRQFRTIAADIEEIVGTTTDFVGSRDLAAQIDDNAVASAFVDARLGEIMAEPVFASDAFTVTGTVLAALVEDTIASSSQDGLPVGTSYAAAIIEAATASSSEVGAYRLSIIETATALSSEDGLIAVVYATLNGTPSANVAMSNGNLTATITSSIASTGVANTNFQTTGKFYFEFTVSTPHSAISDAVGLLRSGGTFTNLIAAGTQCLAAYRSGAIWSNGGSSGKTFGSAWVAGDVIGVAADLTARKAWVRKNNGNWNNLVIGSENPATGVGGVTLYATLGYVPVVGFTSGGAAGDGFTANFGATTYANAAPSGFGNWPG